VECDGVVFLFPWEAESSGSFVDSWVGPWSAGRIRMLGEFDEGVCQPLPETVRGKNPPDW
jgi:hypothetical protein